MIWMKEECYQWDHCFRILQNMSPYSPFQSHLYSEIKAINITSFPHKVLLIVNSFYWGNTRKPLLFQGNVWKKTEVTITSKSDFQIIFEGVRGRDYQGDIAIDDIEFADKYCVGLCSSVNPQQRVDCSGGVGISRTTCVNLRRCCWDDSVPNVPVCFYHPSACASVIPANRYSAFRVL